MQHRLIMQKMILCMVLGLLLVCQIPASALEVWIVGRQQEAVFHFQTLFLSPIGAYSSVQLVEDESKLNISPSQETLVIYAAEGPGYANYSKFYEKNPNVLVLYVGKAGDPTPQPPMIALSPNWEKAWDALWYGYGDINKDKRITKYELIQYLFPNRDPKLFGNDFVLTFPNPNCVWSSFGTFEIKIRKPFEFNGSRTQSDYNFFGKFELTSKGLATTIDLVEANSSWVGRFFYLYDNAKRNFKFDKLELSSLPDSQFQNSTLTFEFATASQPVSQPTQPQVGVQPAPLFTVTLDAPIFQKYAVKEVILTGKVQPIPKDFALLKGNQYKTLYVAADGKFNAVVALDVGLNIVEFWANNEKCKEVYAGDQKYTEIMLFREAQEETIALTQLTPKDGTIYSSLSSEIKIQGSITGKPQTFVVKYRGKQTSIFPDSQGNFTVSVPLDLGKNFFELFANDRKLASLTLEKRQLEITLAPSRPGVIKGGKSITFKITANFKLDPKYYTVKASNGTAYISGNDLIYTAPTNYEGDVTIKLYAYDRFVESVSMRIAKSSTSKAAAKLLAEEAAGLDAKTQIAEEVYGVIIKSSSVMEDFVLQKDEIVAKISGNLVGVKLSDPIWDGDYVQVPARVKKLHLIRAVKATFPDNPGFAEALENTLPDEVRKTGEAYVD